MVEKIPAFDRNGLLPVGDYDVSLFDLRGSVLCRGPDDRQAYPNWDSA